VLAAAERLDVRPRLVRWDDAPVGEQLQRADVVVSTVPSGAADQLAETLFQQASEHSGGGGRWQGVLLDVVYDPWPTALASAWQAGGGAVVDGLAMLVHQAVGQVRLWTGQTPSVEGLRAAVSGVR
jgi:shikimate dehydrogenase